MKSCQALTKKGKPCQGGAMRGQRYCGPHMDQAGRNDVKVTMMEGVRPPDEHFPVATRAER